MWIRACFATSWSQLDNFRILCPKKKTISSTKYCFSTSHIDIQSVPGQSQCRIRTLYTLAQLQEVPSFGTAPGTRSQLPSSYHQFNQPQMERKQDCTPTLHLHAPVQKPLAHPKYMVKCNSEFYFQTLGKWFGVNYTSNKVSNAALTLEFELVGHLRVLREQSRTRLQSTCRDEPVRCRLWEVFTWIYKTAKFTHWPLTLDGGRGYWMLLLSRSKKINKVQNKWERKNNWLLVFSSLLLQLN